MLKTPEIARRFVLPFATRKRTRLKGVTFIGITGSVGKTTTKEAASSCLTELGGTVRNPESDNSLWTVAKTILRTGKTDKYCVAEIGTSSPGMIAPKAAMLRPHIAIITAIGPAHIEHFESVEDIAKEKSMLLKSVEPNGLIILPGDDPYISTMRSSAPSHARVITVGGSAKSDFRAELLDGGESRVRFTEKTTDESIELVMPQPGWPMAINSLFAAAVARNCGMSWNQVVSVLQRPLQLPLRWERKNVGNFIIINDAYNANPTSMKAALDTFSELNEPGDKWVVMGKMCELGNNAAEAHRDVGRHVAAKFWNGVISVGENGRWIAEGLREKNFPEELFYECADATEAARVLKKNAKPGSLVLLKASRACKLERVENALK